MKTLITRLCLAAAVLFAVNAHAVELKLATLAPQGTNLYNGLDRTAKEIQTATNNRVTVKIFAGGVQGDEKDVVRKMRYGQLDGAALTGVGLGLIDPQIRVLELPFLFKSEADVDRVYEAMGTYFGDAYRQKGFEMLGWADVGFVKIFSNKPIKSKKDLAGMKMWMWEGDPLAEEMYKALGVTPVPLAITDVLTSLQTNLIDAAYAPELAAIAFQWNTKTKYMTDLNLVNGTGGIMFTAKAWSQVNAGDQAKIREIIKTQAKQLVAQARQDNLTSKSAVQASGVQIITPEPKAVTELQGIGETVRQNLVGRLYSKELLDRVVGLLQ